MLFDHFAIALPSTHSLTSYHLLRSPPLIVSFFYALTSQTLLNRLFFRIKLVSCDGAATFADDEEDDEELGWDEEETTNDNAEAEAEKVKEGVVASTSTSTSTSTRRKADTNSSASSTEGNLSTPSDSDTVALFSCRKQIASLEEENKNLKRQLKTLAGRIEELEIMQSSCHLYDCHQSHRALPPLHSTRAELLDHLRGILLS
jgi:hypothetical protein